MTRAKLLLGLTALFTTFAITATSASAHFASHNGTSKGPLQLKTSTSATFSLEELGETQVLVTCGEVAKGEWTITGGNADLNLSGQFTKCIEKIAGISNPATVNSGCVLQIEHPGTTLTGGVSATCIVTQAAKGCTITVAAGAPNTGLTTITSAVSETKNTEFASNVTGFVASTTKCGVKATTGAFKGAAIAHEVSLV